VLLYCEQRNVAWLFNRSATNGHESATIGSPLDDAVGPFEPPGKNAVPRLSILIPSMGGTERFEATLASVLQNRPADSEVLVILPSRYDDPYDLAGEVRFVEASPRSDLVDLINEGMQCATAEVVNILSCEVEVLEHWAESVWAQFADLSTGCVVPVIAARADAGRSLTRGVHYGPGGSCRVISRVDAINSACGRRLGPTLAAGFYRRSAVLELGGFYVPLGADLAVLDMALSLDAAGWSVASAPESVVRVNCPASPTRLSFRGGRQSERLFWRHASRDGWLQAVLRHAVTVAGELGLNAHRPAVGAQLLGRLAGWPEILVAGTHQRRVARVRASRQNSGSHPGRDEPPPLTKCRAA